MCIASSFNESDSLPDIVQAIRQDIYPESFLPRPENTRTPRTGADNDFGPLANYSLRFYSETRMNQIQVGEFTLLLQAMLQQQAIILLLFTRRRQRELEEMLVDGRRGRPWCLQSTD